MTIVVMVFALIVATLLDCLLPAWTMAGQAKAPILLCIVMYYALCRSGAVMLSAAVIGGLLCDSISGLVWGCSSTVYLLLAVGIRQYRDIVFSRRWMTHMVLGAIVGMVSAVLTFIVLVVGNPDVTAFRFFRVMAKVVGTGLMGLVSLPIIFRVMARFERITGDDLTEETI